MKRVSVTAAGSWARGTSLGKSACRAEMSKAEITDPDAWVARVL